MGILNLKQIKHRTLFWTDSRVEIWCITYPHKRAVVSLMKMEIRSIKNVLKNRTHIHDGWTISNALNEAQITDS